MTLLYLLAKENEVISASFMEETILSHVHNTLQTNEQEFYLRLSRYMETKTKFRHRTKFNIKKGYLQHQQARVQKPRKWQNSSTQLHHNQSPTKSCSSEEQEQTQEQNMDYTTWKRRRGYQEQDKIFICFGRHAQIRESLLQRGWKENADYHSIFYDYKWAQKLCHVNVRAITDQQWLNHFGRTNCLAVKSALATNLSGLIHSYSCDIHQFFPLSYDLQDNKQMDDFILHFKYQKARSVLLAHQEGHSTPTPLYSLKVALAIYLVSQLNLSFSSTLQNMLNTRTRLINHLQSSLLEDTAHDLDPDTITQYQQQLAHSLCQHHPRLEQESQEVWLDRIVGVVLQAHSQVYPQTIIGGTENIWILKPSEMSRGRGIRCYRNLEKILEIVQSSNCGYVIQKYIERPLIIHNKKFDIRLWAVVRNVNPLQIWVYRDYYLRFSALDYSLKDLSNRLIHLTNNAVQKQQTSCSPIAENMWTRQQFIDHLAMTNQSEQESNLSQRMWEIVYLTWKSVQDQVENRSRSFELFGYDFMVDQRLRPWLLEVNSSPSLDYSTQVTSTLVKAMLEDTVKLTVDYAMTNKFHRNNISTGRFVQITKHGYLKAPAIYHWP